jgi:hypothetical protein
LNVEARHALRQQQSRPLLGVIQKQIEIARSTALLGGALAKAWNYTLTRWNNLARFLEYPELELSGRELHAAGCNRTKKLDTRGKPAAGTEDRRKLPQIETPSARLSGRSASWAC